MNVTVEQTALPGVLIFGPRRFSDERGFFKEVFNRDRPEFKDIGPFVQINWSHSTKATIRGLHYQEPPHMQGKLVWCTAGEVFDVAVDVRPMSPTFGKWVGVWLSAEDGRQLWIPPGLAHGFCALNDTEFVYALTDTYHPECERTIRWDDPDVGIDWPLPNVSPKDKKGGRLKDLRETKP